jgi:hypothetical protein
MDFAKVELAAVEQAVDKTQSDLNELNELQLAMIGGGCGEVVFG